MGVYMLKEPAHIRINVERLVLNQGLGHVHDLCKDEDILETVGDLLGNELHKIWHKLVQTWILPKTGIPRGAIIFAGLIQEGAADLLKVQLEFTGKHMLNQWLHGDIARAAHSGQCRVGVGALGDQFEIARVGGSGILGNRWLHAFYCQPVG
jgi:hypothetical protein